MAAIYAFGLFWIVKSREIRAIQAQQDTGESRDAVRPIATPETAREPRVTPAERAV
jgi:hypothetical protein